MVTVEAAIRGLLIPLQDGSLLLPGSVVAEVVGYAAPQSPAQQEPAWLQGAFSWRGVSIPLVSFELWAGADVSETARPARVAVFKALGEQPELAYYGVVCRQIPRLVTVREEMLEPLEASRGGLPVRLLGEEVLIPDLAGLEQDLQAAWQPL